MGWALRALGRLCGVGHSRETLGSRETPRLGTPGTLWVGLWGESGVGHFREMLGLGTPGTL